MLSFYPVRFAKKFALPRNGWACICQDISLVEFLIFKFYENTKKFEGNHDNHKRENSDIFWRRRQCKLSRDGH